ncbi:MAG: hypothetical protein ABIP17_14715 [Ilumatobacteraceae bacterium]
MKPVPLTIVAVLAVSSACGANSEADPVRSYALGLRADDSADRYRYVATGDVDIRVGDAVTFEFENTGTTIHDLRVVDPDGATLATATPVAVGGRAEVTVTFRETGFHRLNCLVDDHLTVHEMQTLFEVTDPSG